MAGWGMSVFPRQKNDPIYALTERWCWRGAPGHNTLDDLCWRYGVNSLRGKHGALLDAELLAAVYVELTMTRQSALQLEQIIRPPILHAD
jgi:DNA polymerase III epsilon subunit-like protein